MNITTRSPLVKDAKQPEWMINVQRTGQNRDALNNGLKRYLTPDEVSRIPSLSGLDAAQLKSAAESRRIAAVSVLASFDDSDFPPMVLTREEQGALGRVRMLVEDGTAPYVSVQDDVRLLKERVPEISQRHAQLRDFYEGIMADRKYCAPEQIAQVNRSISGCANYEEFYAIAGSLDYLTSTVTSQKTYVNELLVNYKQNREFLTPLEDEHATVLESREFLDARASEAMDRLVQALEEVPSRKYEAQQLVEEYAPFVAVMDEQVRYAYDTIKDIRFANYSAFTELVFDLTNARSMLEQRADLVTSVLPDARAYFNYLDNEAKGILLALTQKPCFDDEYERHLRTLLGKVAAAKKNYAQAFAQRKWENTLWRLHTSLIGPQPTVTGNLALWYSFSRGTQESIIGILDLPKDATAQEVVNRILQLFEEARTSRNIRIFDDLSLVNDIAREEGNVRETFLDRVKAWLPSGAFMRGVLVGTLSLLTIAGVASLYNSVRKIDEERHARQQAQMSAQLSQEIGARLVTFGRTSFNDMKESVQSFGSSIRANTNFVYSYVTTNYADELAFLRNIKQDRTGLYTNHDFPAMRLVGHVYYCSDSLGMKMPKPGSRFARYAVRAPPPSSMGGSDPVIVASISDTISDGTAQGIPSVIGSNPVTDQVNSDSISNNLARIDEQLAADLAAQARAQLNRGPSMELFGDKYFIDLGSRGGEDIGAEYGRYFRELDGSLGTEVYSQLGKFSNHAVLLGTGELEQTIDEVGEGAHTSVEKSINSFIAALDRNEPTDLYLGRDGKNHVHVRFTPGRPIRITTMNTSGMSTQTTTLTSAQLKATLEAVLVDLGNE